MIALLALTFAMPAAWSRLPDLPVKLGVAGALAGVSHHALLVAGGSNFPIKPAWQNGPKVYYRDIYALTRGTSTGGRVGGVLRWHLAGKLPYALGYGVSVTYHNEVVCAGGGNESNVYANVFALNYLHSRVKITQLPSLPIPLCNCAGALLRSTLYVAGGLPSLAGGIASNRVFTMDLSKHHPHWEEIYQFPGAGRILPLAASDRGSFWLMGGASLHAGPDGSAQRHYLRDAYRYTPGWGWKRITDLPYPVVAAPSPAPVDGWGIYVLGGDDGSHVHLKLQNRPGSLRTILRLGSDGHWHRVGEMPAGRVTAPTARFEGGWVVVNGERRPGVRSPEVWLFGP